VIFLRLRELVDRVQSGAGHARDHLLAVAHHVTNLVVLNVFDSGFLQLLQCISLVIKVIIGLTELFVN